ncbi:tripartite tricarboxylate transporter substrate binding protein [Tropicibacter sp. R16_0]|uniref:tripartite tricarboxylate transporter substrate binding protein n=1 Tax=Tropicibacter sp. R16_0 TaxID=2821102 RepID=UPI001ADA7761|nr:tripartite tricarboxylate transporter substrate binding protein [Tropicibacter sp. R16_0]MBO9452811.1 tripartite tricarboxylate transporter substrate binding protein [Tropicibacter sp. R16_0]
MTKLGWLKSLAAGAALAVTGTLAQSGEFPERPIDMIVGFKAGGGTDTYARALASAAEAHTGGQPVVVVNKPGGGGLVGGRFVADQPPTGYTLYLASAGSMVLKNLIKPQVVSTDDFKMVGTIGELTAGIFVPAGSPIQSLSDLIETGKSSDSALRWGHTGRGNVWHMAGLGVLNPNNVKTKDIPFKGGSGVRAALASSEVDFGVMGAHLGRGFEDEVRLLAVLANERHPAAPDAPTAKDLGIDFIPVSSQMIVMAPARTPDDVVAQLSDAVVAITQDASYLETLNTAGLPTSSVSGPDTAANIEASKADWGKLLEGLE